MGIEVTINLGSVEADQENAATSIANAVKTLCYAYGVGDAFLLDITFGDTIDADAYGFDFHLYFPSSTSSGEVDKVICAVFQSAGRGTHDCIEWERPCYVSKDGPHDKAYFCIDVPVENFKSK